MKKFGPDTIKCIVDRAIEKFMNSTESPDSVSFFWKGHYVEASFQWHRSRGAFYLSDFSVVYTRCTMKYFVGRDFNLGLAWCV